MRKHPYKLLASTTVYQNPWISVREDKIIQPDGQGGIYGVVESKDSVMIVPVNDKKEIYLIYTYSYPAQSWNWELPGGGGEGEHAIIASKRELFEETGISAQDWTLLGKTRVCNGLMTEQQITYLARNLAIAAKKDIPEEKIVSHGVFFPFTDIHKMINQGKINDGQTLAGLYLAELYLRAEN